MAVMHEGTLDDGRRLGYGTIPTLQTPIFQLSAIKLCILRQALTCQSKEHR